MSTSSQSLAQELDPSLIEQLKGKTVLVKYGGNAMVNDHLKRSVAADVVTLNRLGIRPVVVHGGGPFIREMLEAVDVASEFVGGHRRTTPEAMRYVAMVLRGRVNGEIVTLVNDAGGRAVGLSGKDAGMVTAVKRSHVEPDGRVVDLGQVGNVDEIDPRLIIDLLNAGYIPVVAPIAVGPDGNDYNVNADMFAGHMAGALQVDAYIALTDIDGLRRDVDDPDSLIAEISAADIRAMIGSGVQGGMIPKVESCLIALRNGVGRAHIVNGTTPGILLNTLLTTSGSGTIITANETS